MQEVEDFFEWGSWLALRTLDPYQLTFAFKEGISHTVQCFCPNFIHDNATFSLAFHSKCQLRRQIRPEIGTDHVGGGFLSCNHNVDTRCPRFLGQTLQLTFEGFFWGIICVSAQAG